MFNLTRSICKEAGDGGCPAYNPFSKDHGIRAFYWAESRLPRVKVFVTAFLSACSGTLFWKVPYNIPDSTRYFARGNKDRGYNQHTGRIPVDDISTIKLPTSNNRSNVLHVDVLTINMSCLRATLIVEELELFGTD